MLSVQSIPAHGYKFLFTKVERNFWFLMVLECAAIAWNQWYNRPGIKGTLNFYPKKKDRGASKKKFK
jgi:hypothetical protein